MSHRAYLYNVNTPSIAENSDTMMMEWGYEMPLMLQPLLLDGGFISGNNYNNHVPGNDSGLYYDAKPGIENLKRFYNFLEEQPGLIKDIEKFKVARDQIFRYLDRLDGRYFHLDMWDVLNMGDEPHADQARDWLATMAHNNQAITTAMDAGDISLLNYKLLKDVSPAFMSFGELLNYDGYDYGWTCIWQSSEDKLPVEIFEENQHWGLKDEDGRILLRPEFDEFFSFGPQNLAVVSKGGKYGYVDIAGKNVIQLTWDDAFDFECSGLAVVALQGKLGLIDVEGNLVVQHIYDELEALGDGDFFNAKINGLWGVIDTSGKVLIDFEHVNEVQAAYGFYHTEPGEQKNHKIFTDIFKYLGEFPIQAVENLEHGLLLIKPHKGVGFYSIYKNDGTLLDSGFEKINRQTNFPDLLVIKKNKKYGAISRKTENYVLPCEFDKILDIGVSLTGIDTNIALIQQKDNKGIYNGGPEHLSWLIPLDNYEEIIWLDGTVFALQKNQMWAIANTENQHFSDFAFDMVVRKPAENGFAYAFREGQVYTVTETDIYPTSKAEALKYADDDYGYYFEYESRKKLLVYGKGHVIDDQRIADELSSVHTLLELGDLAYDNRDYAKAIYFYSIASEKDHAPSMNNLAHIYYMFKEFEDNDKAFFWYRQGALAHNQDAMNGLGMCYKFGIGCPVDLAEAQYWLKEAADSRSALANNNLGDLYSDEGLPVFDLDQALIYYLKAADLGEPKNNWLGYLYDSKGEYEKALEYYQRATDDGNEISAYNLGILYQNGLGTGKNVGLAIACFQFSADRHYLPAHLELARIYKNEKGFIDEKKAAMHLRESESDF